MVVVNDGQLYFLHWSFLRPILLNNAVNHTFQYVNAGLDLLFDGSCFSR